MASLNNKQFSKPRTYYTDLPTTAPTVLYTVPAQHTASVQCIHLVNVGAGNSKVDVHVISAELGLTMHLFHLVTIASKGYLTIDNLPLYLGPGDVVQVTADAADHITATISMDEIYDPNSTHG
jgi:hypothetical protein